MHAVIMAGGKGTRLAPLTDHAPKPMMPILDKPILRYIIELLKKHGVVDITVTLGYMANQIIEAFGDG
ncbi:MAG: NTP transferase domain-containing protein, partial [Clostridia bacterium]|nr:NTP transferase domain-containing protein [Clostridia bacterium]